MFFKLILNLLKSNLPVLTFTADYKAASNYLADLTAFSIAPPDTVIGVLLIFYKVDVKSAIYFFA